MPAVLSLPHSAQLLQVRLFVYLFINNLTNTVGEISVSILEKKNSVC